MELQPVFSIKSGQLLLILQYPFLSSPTSIPHYLEALNEVKSACFGLYLAENYMQKIKDFGYHYMRIVYNIEEINKNLLKKDQMFTFNVVLKAHILFAHVAPFLERENNIKSKLIPNWIRKGMGYWSEQGM